MVEQRNCLLYLLKKHTELTHKEIADDMKAVLGRKIGIDTIKEALIRLAKFVKMKNQLEDLEKEEKVD